MPPAADGGLFAGLPVPAARLDAGGRLIELNDAWLDAAPLGIRRPGARPDARHPLLTPLLPAAGATPPPADAVEIDEAEPPPGGGAEDGGASPNSDAGPGPGPDDTRWWRFERSPGPGGGLLLARDISRARRAEERLRAMNHDQSDLVCRFGPDFNLTFVNEAWSRAADRPADRLVGRPLTDFMPPDQRESFAARLTHLTPEAPAVRSTRVLRPAAASGPDGDDPAAGHPTDPDQAPAADADAVAPARTRWFAWTDRALFGADGRVREYQSVGRDITYRRHAEAELRTRRQENQLILDSVPALIWFKDADDRIVRINRAAAQLVGRPVGEIEGRRTAAFFPEHARRYREDDLAVFRSGRPRLGIVEPIPDVEGRTRWVRTDKVPLRTDPDSEDFDRILAMSIDVTDLKLAEDRIRQSEARFRGLFDRVPAAVFEQDLSGPWVMLRRLRREGIVDLAAYLDEHPAFVRDAADRSRIRGMNQALLDLYGARANQQIVDAWGRGEITNTPEAGRRRLLALWQDRPAVEFEVTGRHLSGRPLDLLVRMVVPRNADDRLDPSRTLISVTDLTERKRRFFDEARVEQAAEERRNLGHELHDTLGQQLTGLSMLTVALQQRLAGRGAPEAEEVAELRQMIDDANRGVRRLIRGLTPESIVAADLGTALRTLMDNLHRTRHLPVDCDVDDPPAGLGDEAANHLLMIAGEATHNAVKHAAPGRVGLSLKHRSGTLTLEVSDDGRGFGGDASDAPGASPAPDAAAAGGAPRPDPRRFSRDHPDAPDPTPRAGGRGQAIMRYRAEQIGAVLEVSSRPGAGTTVRCQLPVPDAEPPAGGPADEPTATAGSMFNPD